MSDGCQAIVASGHPLVNDAAATIIRQGGNAFDAVVAAGFAGAVAEPALTSLGGGGFLLARTREGRATLFDFFVDTPGRGGDAVDIEPHFFPVTVNFSGSAQEFHVGHGSVAVPGTMKGLLHIHHRLGRMPLDEVVRPAVELARAGIVVNSQQAYFLGLLQPIMTLTATGRALFAPDGAYLTAGTRFSNSDLADFMEQLPHDHGESFYNGELAETIAADMTARQGLLTTADLSGYGVIERPPLAVSYRGRKLLTNPPPSFGGHLIARALRLLEQFDLTAAGWGTADHVIPLAAAMVEVERRRTADADNSTPPEDWYAAAGHRIRTFTRGTTHVSVVDDQGNVAAMTTSNGEGSGYIVPGTGIMLNNMMGEDDLHPEGFHATPPGLRVASMMAPSLLLGDEGVELVLGSGGSKRIRTAITQVINNVVDFNFDIRTAVEAPRLHWDGESMQVEPGFPEATVNRLAAHWPVNVWPEREVYFGGVHAVVPGCDGAGDSRRGGCHLRII